MVYNHSTQERARRKEKTFFLQKKKINDVKSVIMSLFYSNTALIFLSVCPNDKDREINLATDGCNETEILSVHPSDKGRPYTAVTS
jgi:hypothetical protein